MSELSVGEQELLLAAFAASPQHWFRSQIVGQRVGLSDRDTCALIGALSQAGLINTDPDRCAQLTEDGREAASRLLQALPKPRHLGRRYLWFYWGCGLVLCLGIAAALWLVVRAR
jgi:hypothetical protein